MFLLRVIYNVYACTETVDVKIENKKSIHQSIWIQDPPLVFDGKTFGQVQTVVFQ